MATVSLVISTDNRGNEVFLLLSQIDLAPTNRRVIFKWSVLRYSCAHVVLNNASFTWCFRLLTIPIIHHCMRLVCIKMFNGRAAHCILFAHLRVVRRVLSLLSFQYFLLLEGVTWQRPRISARLMSVNGCFLCFARTTTTTPCSSVLLRRQSFLSFTRMGRSVTQAGMSCQTLGFYKATNGLMLFLLLLFIGVLLHNLSSSPIVRSWWSLRSLR